MEHACQYKYMHHNIFNLPINTELRPDCDKFLQKRQIIWLIFVQNIPRTIRNRYKIEVGFAGIYYIFF